MKALEERGGARLRSRYGLGAAVGTVPFMRAYVCKLHIFLEFLILCIWTQLKELYHFCRGSYA